MTGGCDGPVSQSAILPGENRKSNALCKCRREMENVTCTKHIVDIAPFRGNQSDQTNG